MRGSPTRRVWVGLGGLVAALALAGCTSAPTESPTPAPPPTSAAPTTNPTVVPSDEVPSTQTPTTAETAPDEFAIDITIADGKVDPNGKKLDVKVGQTIALNVTSDADDEVHAHTDGDGYELEVKAGTSARGQFTITAPGSYEVESHHLEKVIVILNAR